MGTRDVTDGLSGLDLRGKPTILRGAEDYAPWVRIILAEATRLGVDDILAGTRVAPPAVRPAAPPAAANALDQYKLDDAYEQRVERWERKLAAYNRDLGTATSLLRRTVDPALLTDIGNMGPADAWAHFARTFRPRSEERVHFLFGQFYTITYQQHKSMVHFLSALLAKRAEIEDATGVGALLGGIGVVAVPVAGAVGGGAAAAGGGGGAAAPAVGGGAAAGAGAAAGGGGAGGAPARRVLELRHGACWTL